MEDYSKELLRSGIIEAKTGSHETARRYLDRAIYMTSSHDVLAEAWFWMGEVTADLLFPNNESSTDRNDHAD